MGLSVIIGGTIGMGGGAIEYKSGLNLDRTVTKSVNATMEVYKKTKNFYTKTPSEIADIETKLEEGFTNMYMRKETERSLYTRDFVEQLPTKELIPSAIAVQKTTNKNAKSLTALFDKGNDLDIQYKKGLSEITTTQEKLAELQAQHNEIDNESNKQQEVFKKEQVKIEKKIKKLETKNENNRVKRDLERAKIEGSKKTLINNISNQALRAELNNLDITTPKGRLAFISKIKQAIKNGKVKNTKKTLTQAEALVKQSKTINDKATSESNIYKADNRRAREEQGKVNAKSRALANEVEGAKDVLYEEGALVEGAYLEGKNQLSIMAKNMDTIAQDIKNYSKGFNSRTKKKRNTFITQVKTLVGKKQYDANWINNMKKGNQETLTMETMALDLDGNSVNTPFHDRFVKDVQNCRIAQEGMLTKSGQIMQDILGA